MSTSWMCAECSRTNAETTRFCAHCASLRNPATAAASPDEFRPPWRQPGWRDARPDDRCGEPDCDKTVREHIEEFRALVAKPGTLFTSHLEPPDDGHAARILAQAAMLRREAEAWLWRRR